MSELTEKNEDVFMPVEMMSELEIITAMKSFVEDIKGKIDTGERLDPLELDACTAIPPYEFVTMFDIDAMDNENVRTIFDNTEEDPEAVSWTKLALLNGLKDFMVVPYSTESSKGVDLKDVYDTLERHTLLGIEEDELFGLLVQIMRRIWFKEVNITWSRIVSKEALEGNDGEISVRSVAKVFSKYSRQSDPNQTCIYEHYFSKSSESVDATPIELAVHVPVAAGQERETLPKLIEDLARQTIDHSKMKTYFVHNRRKTDFSDDEIESSDEEEMAWMEAFYKDIEAKYPHFQFEARYILGNPSLTIGYVRRKSHLYLIEDYLFENNDNNPLMLNLDADSSQLNADFMQNILNVANDTERPVIATRLGWKTIHIKDQAPTVAKLLKLSSFLSAVVEADRGTPSFYDCGTAIRLRDYCLSGGHVWHDVFYETGDVAHVIKQFAQHDENLGSVVAASKLSRFKSDPRRQLYTLQQRSAPERAWDPDITTFGENDDPVRQQKLDLAELERQTAAALGDLIIDMVDINIGWFPGLLQDNKIGRERFMRKRDVINKGLKILGLPDLNDCIV